jgi:glyceraldehyde 3-phosphate dehydrogenase
LAQFDGRWNNEASAEGDSVIIDGKQIKVTANKAIADTDWSGCIW